jgi:hypothetical protein
MRKPTRRPTKSPIVLLVAVALMGAGLLVALSIEPSLPRTAAPPAEASDDQPAIPVDRDEPEGAPTPRLQATRPTLDGDRTSVVFEAAPWDETPLTQPTVPEHHLAAWKVKPPRPDDHPPEVENPGGVNGDRPARPVPGID